MTSSRKNPSEPSDKEARIRNIISSAHAQQLPLVRASELPLEKSSDLPGAADDDAKRRCNPDIETNAHKGSNRE